MNDYLKSQIKQRTYIAAPRETVYDTLTSADEWNKFFTTGMELDPKPGGVCSFAWKDWGPDKYTLKVPGKVIEAERPNLFSFQWGSGGRETTIRVELTPHDNGTVLTLTEGGYRDTPEDLDMMLECASGWGEAVTLLKFYIEHGIVYTSASATK
jgi:uncharacterized protein YndB with AHSA1/START domain